MALTPKQAAFVAEYLVDLNGTQAAIRAGYSAKTASVMAAKLLAEGKVKGAVEEQMQARAERTEITQDKVLTDIEAIKKDAMREFQADDGRKSMNNHNAALKACELQGRHLKMWNDKLSVTGKDGADLLSNITINLVKAAHASG